MRGGGGGGVVVGKGGYGMARKDETWSLATGIGLGGKTWHSRETNGKPLHELFLTH